MYAEDRANAEDRVNAEDRANAEDRVNAADVRILNENYLARPWLNKRFVQNHGSILHATLCKNLRILDLLRPCLECHPRSYIFTTVSKSSVQLAIESCISDTLFSFLFTADIFSR